MLILMSTGVNELSRQHPLLLYTPFFVIGRGDPNEEKHHSLEYNDAFNPTPVSVGTQFQSVVLVLL